MARNEEIFKFSNSVNMVFNLLLTASQGVKNFHADELKN